MTSEAGRELARRSHEVQRQKFGYNYEREMARRSRIWWARPGSRERASDIQSARARRSKRDARGRFVRGQEKGCEKAT